MEIVDKSIVRPVLGAIVELGSSREQLSGYYEIIDRFCARWLGKPRSAMGLEDEETVYLTHELLREYLRFEGNDKRVALWLLTINRCCRNYGADLSGVRKAFAREVRGTDLAFDKTLLEPILQKVRFYEERHSSAASEGLGGRDALGSFYQWVGVYCTYVYPRLREDPGSKDRSMVSTLAFLISEFISLKAHVSRMAALILAVKEACALARPGGAAESSAGADGETVEPGAETRYVEQILERLRIESSVEAQAQPSERPPAETSEGALEKRVLAAAGKLAGSETGLEPVMEKIEHWVRGEHGRNADGLKEAVAALFHKETPKSREAVRRMAEGLRRNPGAMRAEVLLRLGTVKAPARRLLARLYVLALAESLLIPKG